MASILQTYGSTTYILYCFNQQLVIECIGYVHLFVTEFIDCIVAFCFMSYIYDSTFSSCSYYHALHLLFFFFPSGFDGNISIKLKKTVLFLYGKCVVEFHFYQQF